MATGILSHYRAGTGALCIETREEGRVLRELLVELPEQAAVMLCAAPGGPLRDARTGKTEQGLSGIMAGYLWAGSEPGRVLVVFDWHVLCNAPGHWRALIDTLPSLREPKGCGPDDNASLVVFIGPTFDLLPVNPLRGGVPILSYAPPDRESIRDTLNRLHPLNGDAEACVDALCGLSADAAEQAAAEVLARKGGQYDPTLLWESKRTELRRAGLEVWPAVEELGGLSGLQDGFAEIAEWLRDPQLCQRRILCAGIPGMGKSYGARKLAHLLNIPYVFNLDVCSLKAGHVGESEANVRRAFGAIRAMNQHSPGIVVFDEIDKVASEGLDSGVSSAIWKMILTELQEDTSLTIYWATLNRLEKLDAAMESRFSMRFFFDLGTRTERESVAKIHYKHLGCENPDEAAQWTADATEGFSSREIAEQVCPTVMRRSKRKPTKALVEGVVKGIAPISKTQAEQLKQMRNAAVTLTPANDPAEESTTTGVRRIARKA